MNNWSHDAVEILDAYLREIRSGLHSTDVDREEVIADVRSHVVTEINSIGLETVTARDVERVLQKTGTPTSIAGVHEKPREKQHTLREKKPIIGITGLIFRLIFGVALPAITVGFELFTGLCSSTLFDPMPTVLHFILIMLVIIANLWAVISIYNMKLPRSRILVWLNGLAIIVAAYYALVLIPFSGFALVLILAFGAGLIPLGPLSAFIISVNLRMKLKKLYALNSMRKVPSVWTGVIIAVLLLGAADMPRLLTLTGMQLAAQDDVKTSRDGIRLLRLAGKENDVLRACYGRSTLATDIPSLVWMVFFTPVEVDTARTIYYRMTGTPYNAVKPPRMTGPMGGRVTNADEFDFDQGGDAVAAPVRGLSMIQSRLDADVFADDGTAYMQWTLEFKNESTLQREARARIRLPEGAVVSRLTLWIDGEEREAAFGARNQVKDAYKAVVQRSRDPVLVTTCGENEILLQCFPVPPDGGVMKTRIGISTPVALPHADEGAVRLPYILERNFSVQDELHHTVWVEASSNAYITSATKIHGTVHNNGKSTVRGTLGPEDVEESHVIHVARNPALKEMFSPLSSSQSNEIIRQQIVTVTQTPPSHIAFVIDGSRRMTAWTNAIAKALVNTPSCDTTFILAGDGVTTTSFVDNVTASQWLSTCKFDGGCDNIPALVRGWDAAENDGVIVWLHAAQPVLLSGTEELAQRWKRRPDASQLCDIQFGIGPNAILDELSAAYPEQKTPVAGSAAEDLTALLCSWSDAAPLYTYKRWIDAADAITPEMCEAHSHLVSLWARDCVWEYIDIPGKEAVANAVHYATNFHLVTPVSGAVVLETAQQFAEAGLHPVDVVDMPDVIPEPGSLVIFIIGGILFLVRRHQ